MILGFYDDATLRTMPDEKVVPLFAAHGINHFLQCPTSWIGPMKSAGMFPGYRMTAGGTHDFRLSLLGGRNPTHVYVGHEVERFPKEAEDEGVLPQYPVCLYGKPSRFSQYDLGRRTKHAALVAINDGDASDWRHLVQNIDDYLIAPSLFVIDKVRRRPSPWGAEVWLMVNTPPGVDYSEASLVLNRLNALVVDGLLVRPCQPDGKVGSAGPEVFAALKKVSRYGWSRN